MQEDQSVGKEVSRSLELNSGEKQKQDINFKITHTKNDKVKVASMLPIICNVNPRSIYNKVEEFHTLVEQEDIDLVFLSESWEREGLPLKDIIRPKDHVVISNVSQRSGMGGRPAIVVNNVKYDCQDITNKLVQIPWGVEAVWAILTHKKVSNRDKIQKIACCALYSKPHSRKKSALLDHLSNAFNIVSKKYGRGLHFILAGDTND